MKFATTAPNNTGMIERDGKKVAPFEASFIIAREAGDKTESSGWVSVSSENPVVSMVYYNKQWQKAHVVLSHADGAIVGNWTKDGVVLRDGHYGDTIGRLTPAYVRNGKLGGDKIVWGNSDRAQVIMRDVESGVRRNISVEGDWDDKDLVLDGEKDGIPVIRASRWTPLAAAFCDVPADPTVGVARSRDAATEKPIEAKESKQPETPAIIRSTNMTDQEMKDRDALRAKETVEIFALARDYEVPQEQVNEHIQKGTSLGDFRGIILRDFSAAKAAKDAARVAKPLEKVDPVAPLASTVPADKLAQFSVLRAVRGAARRMNPTLGVPNEDDGIEREICQEALRLIRQHPEARGYQPSGLVVPWDLIAANSRGSFSRDFTVAGGSSNVIAQNLRPDMLVEFLRARLVFGELGVTMLTGLVGDVLIPKQTGTATIAAITEAAGAAESDPTFGQIKLTPYTASGNTIIGRQTMLQTTPSADMLVMNDLIAGLMRKAQTWGLHGTGANGQPVGLLTALANGYQGYAAITEATVSQDAAPTYSEIEALMGTPEEANVDGEFKWCLRPKAFRYLKGIGRVGSTGFVPIATGSPYKGGLVDDQPAACTTSLTSKYAVYGRWDSMVCAMWGAADLIVNPFTYATRGAVEVTVLQSMDYGYRYLPAFGWSSKFAAS